MMSTRRKRNREDTDANTIISVIADRILAPLIQKQGSDMSDVISALQSSRKTEKEKNRPEEPKTVQLGDFREEIDDAVTVFAHGARNALRPFCCAPRDYWGGVGRLVTPRMEQAYTAHISPTMINPRTVYKLGDLGEELNLKWFLYENLTATR